MHKPLSMPALREQRAWLESETHGAAGRFHDGGHTWNCPDRGEMIGFLYRFTDETTAFYFRMRFG